MKKQVNLIIKDRVIRYMVSKSESVEGVMDYGEFYLDTDIIDDGKVANPERFALILEKLVRKKRWKGKQLAFCVPDAFVTIREQLVPKEFTKEEMKSYINMELEESIRLPFSDPVMDFVVIGEENNQSKILLFAYPKERMKEFIDTFIQVGLKPVIADLSSLSVYRLYFQLDLASTEEHLLSVQWGKDAIVLTAFNKNKPVFTRYIKSTLNKNGWKWRAEDNDLYWNGEVEELDQVKEEQLVTIERFMDFYQYSVMDGTNQITKIVLSGDFPELDNIKQEMEERFNLKVETMEQALKDKMKLPSRYLDVLGLAIKNR
ncbi:pilus assembly protein PilM [Aquibacillus koreensis]|uniref:Pilus assembly protein PilM n=1 Tax=Aquibacillus koreensis TaxID=279446 RepID=A0A9X3WL81_9BACI|nr:pilus assembly protein PilM [Aquibacillus koreensis]MCT2537948.1 pilus assembly protein PilM [Aquibacillus koreensis]MDC3419161.1 pilus assembly protein PilM [Aquibacillus koreensis]